MLHSCNMVMQAEDTAQAGLDSRQQQHQCRRPVSEDSDGHRMTLLATAMSPDRNARFTGNSYVSG